MLLVALLTSCRQGNQEVSASLDRIEQVVGQHPDSALAELVRLDSLLDAGAVRIEGDRQMARYALLKTQTHDKNYIDDTSDSLILRAVRYYDEHGSKREQMLAQYYFACIRRNKKDFSLAYSSFLLSANMAEKLDDKSYAGLSYGNVACICRELYSGEDLYYADLSYKCHQAAGDTARMNWSLMLKGIALNYQKRYAEADTIFNRLLHIDTNSRLKQTCLSYYIYQCVLQNNFKKADSLIQLQRISVYPIDYLCRAIVNEHKGRSIEADSCMHYALKISSTSSDRVFYLSTLAILQRERGQLIESNQTFLQRSVLQDSIVRVINTASVSSFEKDYLQLQVVHVQKLLQEKASRYRIIALMSVLLILLAGLLIHQKIRQKDLIIQNYIDTAYQLRFDLENEHLNRQQAERNLDEAEKAAREAEIISSQKIQNLFKEKMQIINILCEKLFNYGESKEVRKSVYDSLVREVETFKDPSFLNKLMNVIDDNFGGLISRLQKSSLKLKEDDYRLLCFMIAGFSIKSICLFFDIVDRDIIYKRRKRLKAHIEASDLQFKDEILRLMG